MRINSRTIETVAKYVKNCGVKSTLQVKPPKLKGFNLAELKPLISDIVSSTKSKFSKLEQEIMNSIKSLKIENGHLIDKNGILRKDLKFIGDESRCKLDPEQFKNPAFSATLKQIFEDSTFIHNHPCKAPLSATDFYFMASRRMKKIIATTPDGGYSFIERARNWTETKHRDFQSACCDLVVKVYAETKKLASTRGITNVERMNRFNEFKHKEFEKITSDFGLKFENKVAKLTDLDFVPNDTFKTNCIERFIDKSIIFVNGILEKQ